VEAALRPAVRVRDVVTEAGNSSGHLAHCCHKWFLLCTVTPDGGTQDPLSAPRASLDKLGKRRWGTNCTLECAQTKGQSSMCGLRRLNNLALTPRRHPPPRPPRGPSGRATPCGRRGSRSARDR